MAALHRVVAAAWTRRPGAFVACAAIAAFLLHAAAAPFGTPLLIDAFAYMRKAIEIGEGHFTPIASHAIGWPLILAPFLAPLRDADSMLQMDAARLVGCAVGAAIVFPAAALARRTLTAAAQPWAVVAVAAASPLARASAEGFAEPIIAVVLTGAIAAAVTAAERPSSLAAAGICAGLACWMHPTGLAVPLITAAVVFLQTRHRRGIAAAAAIMAIASLVAAPALLQRWVAFGSPVAFGQNLRFFAESSDELWTVNAAVPGPLEYLRTHSTRQIADRLLVHGAALELGHLSVSVVQLPVVPFLAIGCALAVRRRTLAAPSVALVLFLAAWVPLYALYGAGRHLVPALPLALVVAAAGLIAAAGASPRADRWVALAAILFVAGNVTHSQLERRAALRSSRLDGMVWGRWIAEHLRGRVVIIEAHELVMMHLRDARVGGADVNGMSAPSTGLTLVRPGGFASSGEALQWMDDHRIAHVVVDDTDGSPAWARSLRAGSYDGRQVTLEYESDTQSRWPIRILGLERRTSAR